MGSYSEARPWAKSIRDEVLSRRMPPWGAVKGYGDLLNDPSLSQEQVMQIAEWVEGGAPEGDVRYLPAPPRVPSLGRAAREKFTRMNVLGSAANLRAIRPLQSVGSAKLNAQLPDGSVVPLLWLRDYKAEWRRTFTLREPLRLPRGSKLVAVPPFAFTVSLFPIP